MLEYHIFDCQGTYTLCMLEDGECIATVSDTRTAGAANILGIKRKLESGELIPDYFVGNSADPQAEYDWFVNTIDKYYSRGEYQTDVREIDDDDIEKMVAEEQEDW